MGRALIVVALVAAVAVALVAANRSRAIEPADTHAAGASAAGGAPRMLELYAPWCSMCASMKPVVEDLAARCASKGVRIDTVDISRGDNEAIAEQFDVRSVPTFLFLDANGFETGRLVGAQTAEDLRRGLEALGAVSCGGPASKGRPVTSGTKEV
jgi:thioredoxin 1